MNKLTDAFAEAELEQVCGGLGEGQMKLQEQMERQSKFLETLSNVMHSMSQIDKTIRNNLR
jgi:hypothetical protein